MNLRRFLALKVMVISIGIAICASNQGSAAFDSNLRWRTRSTPHFEIIYTAKQKQLADEYAVFAETAYSVLDPLFKEGPRKTVVVIDDTTDLANGSATRLPRPQVYVFPVLPALSDSVGSYGNWGQELMIHEMGHIFTFEPAHGYAAPLRLLFGAILSPNMALPRWYHEGLAVELESRYSDFGRLRSNSVDAILRALVIENQLRKEDIARINELSIPGWLAGLRPYLLGSLVLHEIAESTKPETLYELTQRYSRRLPFFMNGPVRDLTGFTYSEILEKAYEKIEAQTKKQLEFIDVAKNPPTQPLFGTDDLEGYWIQMVALSADQNELALIRRGPDTEDQVVVVPRAGQNLGVPPENLVIASGEQIERVSWDPKARRLVYDQVDIYDRYYTYSDLYLYDLLTQTKHRLSYGLRAREPAFSFDGAQVVFTRIDGAQMHLSVLDLRDLKNPIGRKAKKQLKLIGSKLEPANAKLSSQVKKIRDVYTPPFQVRISRPEYINKNKIIFSERALNGSEVLRVMDLLTSKVETVLVELSPAHSPRRTSEGILFVSEASGIPNLYITDLNLSMARPLTNSPTAILGGEWDTQRGLVYFIELSATGPKARILQKPISIENKGGGGGLSGDLAQRQRPTRLISSSFEESSAQRSAGAPGTEKVPTLVLSTGSADRSYSALKYMLPTYWIPMAAWAENGVYILATTSQQDPLGKHFYSLSLGWDTFIRKMDYSAVYTNQQTPISVTAGFSDYHLLLTQNFIRRTQTAQLSGGFYLAGLSNHWRGSLGWDYTRTQLAREYLLSGPTLGVKFQNFSMRGFEISPRSGSEFLLSYVRFLDSSTSRGFDRYGLQTSLFLPSFINDHAFALQLKASVAPKNPNDLLGASTVGGNYIGGIINNQFLMRGYPTGEFLGRNLVTATLEYRFPLLNVYQGYGTFPLFLKRWHGDVFMDGVALDGRFFNQDSRRLDLMNMKRFFGASGVEVKADLTVGYGYPLTMVFGFYYGWSKQANGGPSAFVGLGSLL